MSGTVSHGPDISRQADAVTGAGMAHRRGRGGWVALGIARAVVGGVGGRGGGGVLGAAGARGAGGLGAAAPATRQVVREDLAATTPVAATLGYADSWTVTGQGGGTLTWLPQAGRVIGKGQVLYRVD